MDSRLRGRSIDSKMTRPINDDARHSVSLDMRPQSSQPVPGALQAASSNHHHSSIDVRSTPRENGVTRSPDKQLARGMIGQHITTEKRLSNGSIPRVPVSTRGEASNDSATTSSEEKRSTSSGQAAAFHKAGSAPPTLPAELEEAGSQGVKLGAHSNKTVTHSPLEQSQKDQVHQNRSGVSHLVYDHLDDLPAQPRGRTTPTSEAPATSFEDAIFFLDKRRSGSLSRSSNSSAGSGVYDHLPTVDSPDPPSESPVGGNREITKTDLSMLNTLKDISGMPRRITSQPALSTPSSARESPCDQFGRFTSIDEESSDEDESQRSVTPTNEVTHDAETPTNPYQGVTLRNKKTEALIADPFADIMSPKSASRLRWSQELNPLYDYIKGFKVTDGVKLYDSTPSKLAQRSKVSPSAAASGGAGGDEGERLEDGGATANGKAPSVIVEEEGEEEDEEGGVWDADILSNFSQDTMSMISQDTEQSPTSPTSSYGGDAFGGDTLTLTRVSMLLS